MRRALAVLVAFAALAQPSPGQAPGPGRDVSEVLRELLDQQQATGLLEVENENLAAAAALSAIYTEADYKALWTPEKLGTLIEVVRKADTDGLRPEDYHAAALGRLAPVLSRADADLVTRAQIDLLATDAFCLLLYHLYLGKVDPRSLDAKWNFEPRPVGERGGVSFVLDALSRDRVREAVDQVRPTFWWYGRARDELARYRAFAAAGGWRPVPSGKALKLGMKDDRVPAIRRRLAVTGEFAGEPSENTEFDEPLSAAVTAFQTRHRLNADGGVGPGTLAELNVPVEKRILQIRINLERGRQVLNEITPGELVIVDVAGFEVLYLRERKTVWRSRVQVGKPYRQTPIFKSAIDHIVFNPTWTVPPGILAKDILPAVQRDPGYLEKKGLDVVDRGGRRIDASGIDWAKQTAATFPYMLRQEPGPENALGRVKIMFPNPYLVYLHDTPSRELFEKEDRTFSSGCMRVEKPLELAELLLNDEEKWNKAAIDGAVAAGTTRTLHLARPVPVLVLYWTIDLGTERGIGFKRDPYGRDPRLAAALDAPPGKLVARRRS